MNLRKAKICSFFAVLICWNYAFASDNSEITIKNTDNLSINEHWNYIGSKLYELLRNNLLISGKKKKKINQAFINNKLLLRKIDSSLYEQTKDGEIYDNFLRAMRELSKSVDDKKNNESFLLDQLAFSFDLDAFYNMLSEGAVQRYVDEEAMAYLIDPLNFSDDYAEYANPVDNYEESSTEELNDSAKKGDPEVQQMKDASNAESEQTKDAENNGNESEKNEEGTENKEVDVEQESSVEGSIEQVSDQEEEKAEDDAQENESGKEANAEQQISMDDDVSNNEIDSEQSQYDSYGGMSDNYGYDNNRNNNSQRNFDLRGYDDGDMDDRGYDDESNSRSRNRSGRRNDSRDVDYEQMSDGYDESGERREFDLRSADNGDMSDFANDNPDSEGDGGNRNMDDNSGDNDLRDMSDYNYSEQENFDDSGVTNDNNELQDNIENEEQDAGEDNQLTPINNEDDYNTDNEENENDFNRGEDEEKGEGEESADENSEDDIDTNTENNEEQSTAEQQIDENQESDKNTDITEDESQEQEFYNQKDRTTANTDEPTDDSSEDGNQNEYEPIDNDESSLEQPETVLDEMQTKNTSLTNKIFDGVANRSLNELSPQLQNVYSDDSSELRFSDSRRNREGDFSVQRSNKSPILVVSEQKLGRNISNRRRRKKSLAEWNPNRNSVFEEVPLDEYTDLYDIDGRLTSKDF